MAPDKAIIFVTVSYTLAAVTLVVGGLVLVVWQRLLMHKITTLQAQLADHVKK